MATKKKKPTASSTAVLEKRKPTKKPAKAKRRRGLSNAKLRELAKTNKPPQSWYEEDHTDLY